VAGAAGLLFVRVLADAALCDLDDESADRAHRTGTLPVWLGRYPAWNAAMGLRLASAAGLLIPYGGPVRARVLWAAVTVASSVALRAWRPARVRDVVDTRFALEALVVTAALAAWGGG
jgi:4-hydroxybenzoate polyprenyltransferase